MNENCCNKCKGFTTCLGAALDNDACRCIHFGEFKASVDEAVDRLNGIGIINLLSIEEVKSLIYHTNKR